MRESAFCIGFVEYIVKMKYIVNLLAFYLLASSQQLVAQDLLLEDAEHGTTAGWRISDNTPAGAAIENVSGAPSRYIQFTSSGTSNSFTFGSTSASSGLNIQDKPYASWRMKSDTNYVFYFAVESQQGLRYLYYTQSNSTQPTASATNERFIATGLGSSSIDGTWRTFERNLQDDLEAAQPGNTLIAIHGILVRGSIGLDDVTLSDIAPTPPANLPPQANAGPDTTIDLGQSASLDGADSTDPDGQIVSWQWRDDNDNLIGDTALLSYSPTDAGVHTLTLTVTDNLGASHSDSLSLTVNEGAASPASKPTLEQYELVFNDEFNGSSLDPSKWDTGLLWGPYLPINNEEQLYVDTLGMHSDFHHSPFEFTGSTLKINATATDGNLQPPERPPEGTSVWQPRSYTEYRYNGPTENGPGYQPSDVNYLSGIITSYDSLKMTHGYVEMRAKLPAGRGLWPAFWLLTTHYVEDVPEIDVMEFLGQDVDTLYHTYHYFDIEDNWRKISTPSYTVTAENWTLDFHTFGMAWSPTEIIYYVNGVETRRITDEDYLITGQAMYLIANLAVGGNWPGSPDASTQFPATFEIDYIRAYERKLQPTLNLAADYQLMFEDNFNGSTLDASKWNTSFLWGPYLDINNEEQYYVDSLGSDTTTSLNTPFVLNNGVLSITAREANDPNSFTIPPELPDPNAQIWTDNPTYQQNSAYTPGNYTSGIITSYDSFKFVNGYAEMRAKIPQGQGLWPAFWLLNGYYVGQQPEIDILEVLGQNPHQTFHTFHRLGEDGTHVADQGTTDNGNPTIGYADGFHTYGVRWKRGRIDWYIDGNVVHTYEGSDVPYQLMYVIANLAVGGNWPGSPDSSTVFPATLDIDYIRVYQERHKED